MRLVVADGARLVPVGLYLTVFCRIDLPNDLIGRLTSGDQSDVGCVRVASGSPSEGPTWEAYDITSRSQTSPLSMEVQRGDGLGVALAAAIGARPADADRDRVLSHLTDTVATVELGLSQVNDWELFFETVEAVVAMADGLIHCEGDPSGFYDDVRGQPFLEG